MNRLRIVILLATATACGGDDNLTDGGSDATNDVTTGGDAANDVASDVTSNDVANDTTGNDGATDGATLDGGFACGTTTCDHNTQYCQKSQKGLDGGLPDAAKVDGSTIEVDTCVPYPPSCTADGGAPSCNCITSTTCTCSQSGPNITETCP